MNEKNEKVEESKSEIMTVDASSNIPENATIEAKATIEWYDDNGTVVETEKCYRGCFPLFLTLYKKMKDNPDKKNTKVCVYLAVSNTPNRRLMIAEGTLEEAVATLNKKIILGQEAMSEFLTVVTGIAHVSDLRGILVSGVFGPDEPSVGGFGFLSDCTPVTDEDVAVLVHSASAQLEMFKDKMRKTRGMQFPGDSKIIIPGDSILTPGPGIKG